MNAHSHRCVSVVLFAILLAACGGPKPAAPARQYQLKGVVIRLDPQVRTAVIKHEKIDGWMDAMSMEFPVREASEFQKLSAGKRITATVYVTDDSYWLGNIADAPREPAPEQAQPAAK